LLGQAQGGAHRVRDRIRDENKHGNKTKKDQKFALDRYVLFKFMYSSSFLMIG